MAWTASEVSYLTEHYKTKTVKQIAKDLNKNFYAVKEYAGRLGLSKSLKWTDTEIEYLLEHYLTTPTAEIAAVLGRSPQALCTKAYKLLGSKSKNKSAGPCIPKPSKKIEDVSGLKKWLNKKGMNLSKSEALTEIHKICKLDKKFVSKEYDKWRGEYMKTKYI